MALECPAAATYPRVYHVEYFHSYILCKVCMGAWIFPGFDEGTSKSSSKIGSKGKLNLNYLRGREAEKAPFQWFIPANTCNGQDCAGAKVES